MINSEIYYNQLQKKYSRSITLGLSRVKKALRLLNNPHLKLKRPCNIIGSDGKFTCLRAIQYFIEANGNTTTANFSPHLYNLRTRFWLKNRFISLKEIKKYEKKISKLKVKLSLFEVLTLIHILAASKENADFSLQESGLLFKGDASRVWDKPFMQVCTNLNKQHLEWVYPKTINEICRQKVGYMSNNTNIYIGKQKPKVLGIVKKILKKNKFRFTHSNQISSTNCFDKVKSKQIINKLSVKEITDFIKQNRNVPKKERLHADGITFDINSPEALDEIFFNNNKEFVKNELVNYIQLILLSEKKEKYLSKNNLNFKRIDLIHSILPNSIFLIPIREPLQHAYSLLNQHLHFSRLQKEDDYIRRYMNYLGHNEFGLDHKSWNNPIHFKDLNNINYWLEQWRLFYQNILKNYQTYNNCFFIIYEELTNPNYVKMLLEKINFNQVENLNLNYFKNSNKKEIDIDYAKDIYENAKDIYTDFKYKFMHNNSSSI